MNGRERFEYYLIQSEELLRKAGAEQNPGWWLFSNDLRTKMFMLEALAKLYSKLHDKNIFEKLQDRFKELEDELGDIGYYDEYESEYKSDPAVPAEVITYFIHKKEKHTGLFNEILKEGKWLKQDGGRIEKIRKKLDEVSWLSEQEEILAIQKYYGKAIESIKKFYAETNGAFSDMEEHVHELRRKLRWLSIYPQALRGSIQLSDKAPIESHMEKYLVAEIVNSPFNKMPEPTGNRHVLLLEKNYFLSLSWLIAELGKLKDAGLGHLVIEEALKNSHTAVGNSDTGLAVQGKPSVDALLKNASDIARDFFAEGNLEKLVVGVVEV